jgi:hypothetical protein
VKRPAQHVNDRSLTCSVATTDGTAAGRGRRFRSSREPGLTLHTWPTPIRSDRRSPTVCRSPTSPRRSDGVVATLTSWQPRSTPTAGRTSTRRGSPPTAACSRRRGNDARPRLRGVAGPRRHGLSGAGTTRSTSHRLILQSVVHSRGATSRRNTHPESPLLESRRVCERKGRGSTGALSVGSPSFVGEMVAGGWRELPRVRLDGLAAARASSRAPSRRVDAGACPLPCEAVLPHR